MVVEMTKVNEALKRTKRLANIIKATRDRAFRNPKDKYNFDLELRDVGDKGDERKQLEDAFEELAYIVDYLAVIDLCAVFESEFRAKLGTAIGEARRAVEKQYKIALFSKIKEKLVHDTNDFQSLAEIITLVEGAIGQTASDQLKVLQETRNRVTHGSVEAGTIKVTADEAHTWLVDLLADTSL